MGSNKTKLVKTPEKTDQYENLSKIFNKIETKTMLNKMSSVANEKHGLVKLFHRRRKIELGKHLKGYKNYTETVPRFQRNLNWRIHPRTPNPDEKCSNKAFEGKLKEWRKSLTVWDSTFLETNGWPDINPKIK